jgi:predicted nucleic acid-binding Zn ribbon protein
VREILDDVFEQAGIRQQISRVGVLSEWNAVVGDRIAGVTRPRSVSGSTLVVEVRSSAWLMELNLMRHEILRRLNAGREEDRIDRLILVLAESQDGVKGPT